MAKNTENIAQLKQCCLRGYACCFILNVVIHIEMINIDVAAVPHGLTTHVAYSVVIVF